jgi:predicted nucleic acid-binding protein
VPKASLVSNTSPLLYLGRIGHLNLLPGLFKPVFVPEQVALELDAGRLIRRDTIDPRSFDWIRLIAVSQNELDALPENWLGLGEQAVIAYARKHRNVAAALDDL